MYSALLLQLGYLGNMKLSKSNTVNLLFLLIVQDMHPARVDNRDSIFYCQGLRNPAGKGETPAIEKIKIKYFHFLFNPSD